MVFKSIVGTVSIILMLVSFNSNAGDGVITRDTETGLEWLDVTRTAGMTYNEVNAWLAPGGLYEDWRRASNEEALALWSAFSIDLSPGAPSSATGWNQNVVNIASYLGNTSNHSDYPQMLLGVTNSTSTSGYLYEVGAWIRRDSLYADPVTTYVTLHSTLHDNNVRNDNVGTYLVREVSAVPIPAAIWLFGSGLIGLVGFARRKKA